MRRPDGPARVPRQRPFAPLLRTVYAVLCLLASWTILHVAIGSAIVPSPWVTAAAFVDLLPGALGLHLLSSLGRILAALSASLLLGVVVGLWTGLSARSDRWIAPIVYLLYPLPKIAFLPILMILFGLGNAPKILLIVFILVFQVLLAVRDGVREIPAEWFLSVRSTGLGRGGLLVHLVLPAILPKLLTAVRIGIGIGLSVLFFAESFATTYGIGYFIMNSWLLVDYPDMYAGILAMSLMGWMLFSLVDLLESRACRWVRVGKT